MTICSYATCTKTAKTSSDGWDFCWHHYREHLVDFHGQVKQHIPREQTNWRRGDENDFAKARDILEELGGVWSVEAIVGRGRLTELVHLRWTAMYLMYEETGLNYNQIARIFDRGCSSVVYGIEKIREELEAEPAA